MEVLTVPGEGGGRLSKLDNGDGDVCGVVKEDLLKKKN